MQLSKRLEKIAELVPEGMRLVDVGCDHGYLPIYLLKHQKIPGAIAMDVRPGPLARAKENIKAYGLEDYIETRLSDGLKAMERAEGEVLVIAGMGGPLMEQILTESASVADEFPVWILQPQSDIPHFRRYLEKRGRRMEREEMVLEDGKYYPMMRAVKGHTSMEKEIYYLYGKELLKRRDKVLYQFLERERRQLEKIQEQLSLADSSGARERMEEILKEKEQLAAALKYYEM